MVEYTEEESISVKDKVGRPVSKNRALDKIEKEYQLIMKFVKQYMVKSIQRNTLHVEAVGQDHFTVLFYLFKLPNFAPSSWPLWTHGNTEAKRLGWIINYYLYVHT